MKNIRNQNDPTDPAAMGPAVFVPPIKTASSYSEPGLPTPPGGWGKKLGMQPKMASDTIKINDGTI